MRVKAHHSEAVLGAGLQHAFVLLEVVREHSA